MVFASLVVDEGLGVVVAKSLLSHFADRICTLDKSVTKNVCEFALGRLLSRTVSFEEQVSTTKGAVENWTNGSNLHTQ